MTVLMRKKHKIKTVSTVFMARITFMRTPQIIKSSKEAGPDRGSASFVMKYFRFRDQIETGI